MTTKRNGTIDLFATTDVATGEVLTDLRIRPRGYGREISALRMSALLDGSGR